MAFWPFKRRRHKDAGPQDEKAPPTRAATAPQSPVSRRPSKKGSWRRRRASVQQTPPPLPINDDAGEEKKLVTDDIPRRRGSIEDDITALPVTQRLQYSPHLRPVDSQKAPIPYNFRQRATSQTNVSGQEYTANPSRPQTINSQRRAIDNAPSRKPSKASTKSRKQERAVREEQIRAMTAAVPIPKRLGGDGLLRRDSQRRRGPGMRESSVSLPPEGSIHSAMSGVLEQRGWEVGSLAVFNPRPAVRLSGTPQYVSPGSLPNASGFLYRIDSLRAEDKTPVTRENERKRRTVGNEANDLDAGDLRLILERDAKRRARRQQERQEKLDRKLRAKASQDQADADEPQWKEMERAPRVASPTPLVGDAGPSRGFPTPPTAVHPAFRPRPTEPENVATSPKIEDERQATLGALESAPVNPFTDAAALPSASPRAESPAGPLLQTLAEEEAAVETAKAVRLSQTRTPPLSPVRGPKSPAAKDAQPPEALSKVRTADIPPPPPPILSAETTPISATSPISPTSPTERKLGGWASIFRRDKSFSRRTGKENRSPTSQTSFSNTSRESMRTAPLPPHLVGNVGPRRASATRSNSGTPVRTMSKFREDLPEMPNSPLDSRTQSPDVATMAAAAASAAARRGKRSQSFETPTEEAENAASGQTPTSPAACRRALMSTSMASIDSEGSWLASSGKRQSNQSALSRSYSQRRHEMTGSYEELGGSADKDAEYIKRNSGLHRRKLSSPALVGASPDEESEIDLEATAAAVVAAAGPEQPPLTVHESLRRKPTLVHRAPERVRSREGLLAELVTPAETPGTTPPPETAGSRSSPEMDVDDLVGGLPESQLQHARSVRTHGSRHSRQFSAGSARLLDVTAGSSKNGREGTASPPPAEASTSAQKSG